MIIKDIDLQNYMFRVDAGKLPEETKEQITTKLRQEMIEIFNGSNIF